MFTDAGVMGILELMGWSKRRAYQLSWIENRELILPGVRKASRNNNRPAAAPSGGISEVSRASAQAGERSGRKGRACKRAYDNRHYVSRRNLQQSTLWVEEQVLLLSSAPIT